MVDSLRRSADFLRAGKIEDANRIAAEATDAIGVLVYAIPAAGRVLGDAASALHNVDNELQPWIEALVHAQSEMDWLRVADCLEYEVAELVGNWSERIERVESALADAADDGIDASNQTRSDHAEA